MWKIYFNTSFYSMVYTSNLKQAQWYVMTCIIFLIASSMDINIVTNSGQYYKIIQLQG